MPDFWSHFGLHFDFRKLAISQTTKIQKLKNQAGPPISGPARSYARAAPRSPTPAPGRLCHCPPRSVRRRVRRWSGKIPPGRHDSSTIHSVGHTPSLFLSLGLASLSPAAIVPLPMPHTTSPANCRGPVPTGSTKSFEPPHPPLAARGHFVRGGAMDGPY